MSEVYYIHSDLVAYLKIQKILKKKREVEARKIFLELVHEYMYEDILDLFGKKIILPVYYYEFTKYGLYDVLNYKSQT